jgi:queuine tRNA-ribosyltransferase
VLPTRHARHAVLFTSQGILRLKNAEHARSDAPPDPACDCTTCTRHSRAYLRHLLTCGDALGARLLSLHNIAYYMKLVRDMREAIEAGRLRQWLEVWRKAYLAGNADASSGSSSAVHNPA